jgi:GNAT superfamily N-acetyltransferase
MYEALDRFTLKTGEPVELGVVKGPEPGWSDRLEAFLAHKGDYWKWGNEQVLRYDRGIDAFYYILHRDGAPFANIMTIEYRGVGILGHVYTDPQDRRKGAASTLLRRLMDHFRSRDGQALYLGTGYDSPAYHIYRTCGFESVEPGSGSMACFTDSPQGFVGRYFARGPVDLKPLQWAHWPASPPLFLGDWPGSVRCVPLRILGRQSTEGPALRRLMVEFENREAGKPAVTTAVLEHRETSAVVGMSAYAPDPIWPGTVLVDVYCHPDFWRRAPELIEALELPSAERRLAYADASCPAKGESLSAAGYRQVACLPHHTAACRDRTTLVDVTIWQKS